MPLLTDQEYHTDSTEWGQAQFLTLEEIIDNILSTSGNDSYFKNAEKHQMSIHGKQGLKRLKVDLKTENKMFSFQLGPEKIFAFPKYMTNWHRISVYNKCKKLSPLRINNSPMVEDYLQDNLYKILYDNTGSILKGSQFNAEKGNCCIDVDPCEFLGESICSGCKEEDFSNSWAKANKEGGYFQFSEDLVDRVLVVEFQTAGLDRINNCDVKVHQDMELTLENWIKWKLLEGNRNIPMSDVLYYKNLFKIEKNRSKDLMAEKITIEEISQLVSLRYSN